MRYVSAVSLPTWWICYPQVTSTMGQGQVGIPMLLQNQQQKLSPKPGTGDYASFFRYLECHPIWFYDNSGDVLLCNQVTCLQWVFPFIERRVPLFSFLPLVPNSPISPNCWLTSHPSWVALLLLLLFWSSILFGGEVHVYCPIPQSHWDLLSAGILFSAQSYIREIISCRLCVIHGLFTLNNTPPLGHCPDVWMEQEANTSYFAHSG